MDNGNWFLQRNGVIVAQKKMPNIGSDIRRDNYLECDFVKRKPETKYILHH
jgi:hypothetical protein